MGKQTYNNRLVKLEAARPAEPLEIRVIWERRGEGGKPISRRLGPLYVLYPGKAPKLVESEPHE